MTNDTTGANPYDEVFYPSYTHAYSHPDRLATQALLWGMDPAPVKACRVLELGCGDGSNLAPMAYGLPESRFLGVDLSAKAVERGRGMIRDLGLQNIELRHGDIMDIDASLGQFDYLIAHGVFSWVPPEVRDKILAVCRENLAPQGVAFISFLAYPGSHVRAMLRDMMLYRAGDTADPDRILAASREVTDLIIAAAPSGDAVQKALHSEAARVAKAFPQYLFHDDLAEWSAPYYFVQFAGMAAANGLQYLAEADPTEMVDFHLPVNVRDGISRLAPGRLEHEQYIDFLKGRRFRQTLLCHAGIKVGEDNAVERVSEMLVSSPAAGPNEPIDLAQGIEASFVSPRGPKLDTPLPMGKAAMAFLVQTWPRRIPFPEVVSVVRGRLGDAGLPVRGGGDVESGLAQFFHHLNAAGMVELHTDPTRQATALSDRPLASPVVRWQAACGNRVTTLRHFGLRFEDDAIIRLLPLLDGTRTHEELIARVLAESLPAADGRTLTESDVMERLQRLAAEGVLIG